MFKNIVVELVPNLIDENPTANFTFSDWLFPLGSWDTSLTWNTGKKWGK